MTSIYSTPHSSYLAKPTPYAKAPTRFLPGGSAPYALFGSKNESFSAITNEQLKQDFPWTEEAIIPSITKKDLDDAMKKLVDFQGMLNTFQDIEDKSKIQRIFSIFKVFGKLYWNQLKFVATQIKYRKDMLVTSRQVLPDEIQTNLKQYRWSTHNGRNYWWDRLRHGKAFAETERIKIEGPPSIKNLQTYVTAMEGAIKTAKANMETNEKLVQNNEHIPPEFRFLIRLIRPINTYLQKRMIKDYELKKEIYYNVKTLPIKTYKAEFDSLKQAFESENSSDTINNITDALDSGSGSMANTYRGKSSQGKKLVFKFIQPEITHQRIKDYQNYFYFQNLQQHGTDVEGKYLSALSAELDVKNYLREIDSIKEANSTRHAAQQCKELELDGFSVPQVYASSPTGRSLVLEDVGNVNLAELGAQQRLQLLLEAVPDLLPYLLFADEIHSDYTGGNIIAKGTRIPAENKDEKDTIILEPEAKAALIDFGRTITFSQPVQQSALKLMSAFHSIPKRHNDLYIPYKFEKYIKYQTQPAEYFSNEQFLNAFEDFMKMTPHNPYTSVFKEYEAFQNNDKVIAFKTLTQTFYSKSFELSELLKKEDVFSEDNLSTEGKAAFKTIIKSMDQLKEDYEALLKEDDIQKYQKCEEKLETLAANILIRNKQYHPTTTEQVFEMLFSSMQPEKVQSLAQSEETASILDVYYNVLTANQLSFSKTNKPYPELETNSIPLLEIAQMRGKLLGTLSQYFNADVYTHVELETAKQRIGDISRLTPQQLYELFSFPNQISPYFNVIGKIKRGEISIENIQSDEENQTKLYEALAYDQRIQRVVANLIAKWPELNTVNISDEQQQLLAENIAHGLLNDFSEHVRGGLAEQLQKILKGDTMKNLIRPT